MSEIPNPMNQGNNQPPVYSQPNANQQVPPGGYQQPQGGYQNFPPQPQHYSGMQESLPGAGGILTLGILGILLCAGIGIILSIIAMAMAPGAIAKYNQFPGRYTESSLSRVKAGRTCAIIGACLTGIVILIVIAANA